jgi:hypothetical protein
MAARKPDGMTLQRRVVRWALEAGRRVLPDYSHPKSPKTYTQPQLLACLVLRAFGKYTYRGVVEAIADGDALRRELGLADDRVPRHTTLEEFASRTDPRVVEHVVAEVLAMDGRPVEELAEDSTGLQAGGASAHYLSRTGKARGGYVKLSLAVACGTLLAVAAVASCGPTHDVAEARELDWRAAARCRPRAVYKDAGYDSEWAHVFWRQGCGASSFIPPVARGGFGVVRSRWRAEMAARGMPACYGRRWHVESFISGLKRSTGDRLLARSDAARFTEAMFRLLAYQCRRA